MERLEDKILLATLSIQDGSWHSPSTWSDGVPDATSDVEISHAVSISLPGDLNGDGRVWVEDYVFWRDETDQSIDDLVLIVEAVFGLSAGGSEAEAATIDVTGSLTATGATLTVDTLTSSGDLALTGSVLVIRDTLTTDAEQLTTGLLGVGGNVSIADTTIRSEDPQGTRGHVMFMGDTNVSIRDSAFADLGRTTNSQVGPDNLTGRYALHFHQMRGGQDIKVIDSTFTNGRRWAIAIHGTDGATVSGNTIDNFRGAGIVLEDGSERDNVIEHNTIRNITGWGTPYSRPNDSGFEGSGIWSAGVENHIRHNEVYDTTFAGYTFWVRGRNPAGYREPYDFVDNFAKSSLHGFWMQGALKATNGTELAGEYRNIDFKARDVGKGISQSYNGGTGYIVGADIVARTVGIEVGPFHGNVYLEDVDITVTRQQGVEIVDPGDNVIEVI